MQLKINRLFFILFLVTLFVFAALFAVGIVKDVSGASCAGFMGGRSACVETHALIPIASIGLPIFVLFGVGYSITRTSKPKPSRRHKKNRS